VADLACVPRIKERKKNKITEAKREEKESERERERERERGGGRKEEL